MPSDLIYREYAKDYARHAMAKGLNILEYLDEVPAACFRPVVLCRDCINYIESGEANGEKMCVIDAEWRVEYGCYYGFTVHTPPDWFCAGGKKREES